MKQELPANQHSSSPATRARVTRTRDKKPGMESPNGVSLSSGLKSRPKSSSLEGNSTTRSKIVGKPGIRNIEQFARLRRSIDTDCKGSENESEGKASKDDKDRRLKASESLVTDLQAEVSSLKTQLEKLQSLNIVLDSQNRQLTKDLSAAEAKIKELKRNDQVEPNRKGIQEFKDVRDLIANKLELFRGKIEVKENRATKMQSVAPEPGSNCAIMQSNVLSTARTPPPSRPAPISGPPPPPPPPPCRTPLKTNTMQKATSLVDFYHSLTKRDGKKEPLGTGNSSSPGVCNAHNSIVDELQNRSAHLLAIKADVEKKGDFINNLIQKVQSVAFTDIEDVLTFVDWLDRQLSVLADERAVLRHFKWPERKADALREAAFEYRDLKQLQSEVSSFEDDISLSCEVSLKKIAAMLDKSERSIHRLIKLRDTNKLSYSDCKIPMDWMLDSGMVSKIKMASVKLAKVYVKRVSNELELARHLEKELVQETLLYQGVHFAYRVYQFAGGLDFETMRVFEDLKERAQLHRRGSKQLLHATTLP